MVLQNENKSRVITGTSSLFLDTLRVCAALIVFFVHAHDQWFPSQETPSSPFGKAAHAAVIVFFVLSGYVIAHTTTSNNRGKMQYFEARFSKLWSVVLPALVITAVIELIIRHYDPVLMIKYARGVSWPRYIMSGCFLNEIWFFSSAPPVNVPLWSLGYEFWYYIIFGVWFYRKTGWRAILPTLLACFFVGPNILLMFPIWLAGCFVYNLPRPKINRRQKWFLAFTSLALFCICVAIIPLTPNVVGPKPLFWAGQFISDWIGCIFIAFALWILPAGQAYTKQPKLVGLYRRFANLTFPLYVLHYPLLILYHILFTFRANDSLQFYMAMFTVIFVSIVIGIFLENMRIYFTDFFKWLFSSMRRIYVKITYPKTIVLIKPEAI